MDPTDILIESLIKAASTEVVKKGVDAISTRLRSVFDRGNRDEIKKIIEEDSLALPLSVLAKESLDSSYVVPFSSPNEARPSHKVDFFFHVLEYFFKLSAENNMDILVPGSLAGTEDLSLFSTSGGIPSLMKEGLQISVPEIRAGVNFAIIPAGADSMKVFEEYKDSVTKLRNESDNYVVCRDFLKEKQNNFLYNVRRISAGTVYFKFWSLCSPQFTNHPKVKDGISIASWSEGIKSMLRHAADFPGIDVLPAEEVINLIALADEFRERTRRA